MSSNNSTNGALETGHSSNTGLGALLEGSARILLASHGTDGARAAEDAAIAICTDNPSSSIHHLIVVPKALWHGMTGDDWLNNGATRNTFRRYVESTLQKEIDADLKILWAKIEPVGIRYTYEIVVGEPEESLLEDVAKNNYDLLMMGSPRPKGKSGLRSRMRPEVLVKALNIPLMVIPYPKSDLN